MQRKMGITAQPRNRQSETKAPKDQIVLRTIKLQPLPLKKEGKACGQADIEHFVGAKQIK